MTRLPPPDDARTGCTGGRIGGSDPEDSPLQDDPVSEPDPDDVDPFDPPVAVAEEGAGDFAADNGRRSDRGR